MRQVGVKPIIAAVAMSVVFAVSGGPQALAGDYRWVQTVGNNDYDANCSLKYIDSEKHSAASIALGRCGTAEAGSGLTFAADEPKARRGKGRRSAPPPFPLMALPVFELPTL